MSTPSSSAASYTSGRVMWPWMRSRSRPASAASATSRAQVFGRRLGERHPGGPGVGALEEQPLAVDGQCPVVHRHLAQPGSDRAGVAGLVVDGHGHLEQAQRLVAERAGHHSFGLSTPKVHSTEFVPLASGCSSSRSTSPSSVVRTRTVRASSLSSSALTMTLARARSASRHRRAGG